MRGAAEKRCAVAAGRKKARHLAVTGLGSDGGGLQRGDLGGVVGNPRKVAGFQHLGGGAGRGVFEAGIDGAVGEDGDFLGRLGLRRQRGCAGGEEEGNRQDSETHGAGFLCGQALQLSLEDADLILLIVELEEKYDEHLFSLFKTTNPLP